MAGRQRPRTPAQAPLRTPGFRAAVWSLVGLLAGHAIGVLGGCSQAGPEVRAADEAGLVAAHPAPEHGLPRAAADAIQPEPARAVDPLRARALSERFRARIAHWTAEASRLTHGQASSANVRVAACVRVIGTRGDLVALRADAPQPPASNLKLVTTAAALFWLGPGAEWVTPFEAGGALEAGILRGDLVVRAAGDPLFDPAGQGEVEGRLREVARALRAVGLERVEGDVVLDEGSFLTPGPGPAWPDRGQHWAEYCALAGGFSANAGVLHAQVRANAIGAAASIAVHPAPHGLKSSYDVRTVAGSKPDVRIGATTTTATVRGTLGQKLGRYEAEFAHPDPVALFGALLLDALDSQGVAVHGGLRRTRDVPRGPTLAELRSPLDACMEGINADSRNGLADQLFLALGHAVGGGGTRAGGARAVALALERLDLPGADLQQVDGSGLSRENRVSARAICALLERVLGADPEAARIYRGSLAVMGRKGTLESRLAGTEAEGRVFAKTGWIAGVSCLSGYAEPEGGEPCVFSILVEYPSALGGLNTGCFKKLQDELVLLLFEDGV